MTDRKPEKATRDRSWWETKKWRRESITKIKRNKREQQDNEQGPDSEREERV